MLCLISNGWDTQVKNIDTQSRVAAVNNVQVNFHLQDTRRSKETSGFYANPHQGIGVVIELREEHAVVSEPDWAATVNEALTEVQLSTPSQSDHILLWSSLAEATFCLDHMYMQHEEAAGSLECVVFLEAEKSWWVMRGK